MYRAEVSPTKNRKPAEMMGPEEAVAELEKTRDDLEDADRQIRNQARYANFLRAKVQEKESEMNWNLHLAMCATCQRAENSEEWSTCKSGYALKSEYFANRSESYIRECDEVDNRENAHGNRKTEFGRVSRTPLKGNNARKRRSIRLDV